MDTLVTEVGKAVLFTIPWEELGILAKKGTAI